MRKNGSANGKRYHPHRYFFVTLSIICDMSGGEKGGYTKLKSVQNQPETGLSLSIRFVKIDISLIFT